LPSVGDVNLGRDLGRHRDAGDDDHGVRLAARRDPRHHRGPFTERDLRQLGAQKGGSYGDGVDHFKDVAA
jgi:hypothetical protein